jgi:hypothetical protein
MLPPSSLWLTDRFQLVGNNPKSRPKKIKIFHFTPLQHETEYAIILSSKAGKGQARRQGQKQGKDKGNEKQD